MSWLNIERPKLTPEEIARRAWVRENEHRPFWMKEPLFVQIFEGIFHLRFQELSPQILDILEKVAQKEKVLSETELQVLKDFLCESYPTKLNSQQNLSSADKFLKKFQEFVKRAIQASYRQSQIDLQHLTPYDAD